MDVDKKWKGLEINEKSKFVSFIHLLFFFEGLYRK
jgi:hypothetical protein